MDETISLPDINAPSPEIIRMACSLCRRRKLKCNRQTPRCDSCIKLQQECVYGVVRVKKVTRKERTRTLEGRLAQIEKLLRIQDGKNPPIRNIEGGSGQVSTATTQSPNEESAAEVEEDTIRELENIYFEKFHPSLPMLHRERYMQSTLLEAAHQPPIFLRHAVWAAAASISPDHANLEAPLCYSARKYLEDAELRDAHLDAIGVTHVQTWTLIAALESKNVHIHRFWMSTGRAVRMAQLMGLFCIDKVKEDRAFDHLAEPRDWVEREEWRRTFWMTFCLDRYGSMGTGWPLGIDDRDIDTLLPGDEEDFQNCRETKPLSLMEGMTPQGSSTLSPFSAQIVITALSSRKMMDVKTAEVSDLRQSRDPIGAFVRRSSWLDSTLSTIFIPYHLRMPSATNDPLVVFLNMICHTTTIKVIQMAMGKAGDDVPREMVVEGNRKMLEAAAAITNCMRGQSTMADLSLIHPFTSFCLYVAATVFASSFAANPSSLHHLHSLSFLVMSMNSLKAVNPLVNAFLIDIYRDFPKLPEWLDSASESHNLLSTTDQQPTQLATETEDQAGIWDIGVVGKQRIGFYQGLSKENSSAAGVGLSGTDMGFGDFSFEELGGMAIADGEVGTGVSGGGLEFLNGVNGGIGGWELDHP